MPEEISELIVRDLWLIIPTVLYFLVGLVLFGVSVLIMEKITPFSIRHEIEEDHNTALGIVIAGALIGLAIILSSAIH